MNGDVFINALRRKYGTPAAVMRRLGFDEKLLKDVKAMNGNSKDRDMGYYNEDRRGRHYSRDEEEEQDVPMPRTEAEWDMFVRALPDQQRDNLTSALRNHSQRQANENGSMTEEQFRQTGDRSRGDWLAYKAKDRRMTRDMEDFPVTERDFDHQGAGDRRGRCGAHDIAMDATGSPTSEVRRLLERIRVV